MCHSFIKYFFLIFCGKEERWFSTNGFILIQWNQSRIIYKTYHHLDPLCPLCLGLAWTGISSETTRMRIRPARTEQKIIVVCQYRRFCSCLPYLNEPQTISLGRSERHTPASSSLRGQWLRGNFGGRWRWLAHNTYSKICDPFSRLQLIFVAGKKKNLPSGRWKLTAELSCLKNN